ncbi:MAG TPA: glycosyltransferase [Steroidobacteraceae bacterium]
MNHIDVLSVIVPVADRHDDLVDLYRDYLRHLQGHAATLEFIFVIDGNFPQAAQSLHRLAQHESSVHVIELPRQFGESTALTVGFEHSTGKVVMTLPAYRQVESAFLGGLLDTLGTADMVVARRFPRVDSKLQRARGAAFNGLLHWVTGSAVHDIGCNVRAIRRHVLNEIRLYGDLYMFLPLLAHREGFRVVELNLPQSRNSAPTFYKPGVYVRRLLDILTIFFLLKFTKKPLRFFGLVGAGFLGLGALALSLIVVQRLVFQVPLADRPALLLSTLLVVLGVQMVALGLVGELIIFTHAGDLKEYKIERILAGGPDTVATKDSDRPPIAKPAVLLRKG